MEGWIKLHRKITTWEWWDDHNTTRLFVFIITQANHKEKKWQGNTIKRGEFITSYPKMAALTGLSIKQIRTSINHLKKTGEVAVKSTNKFTKVIVENYSLYQINGGVEGSQKECQGADKGQTKGRQRATTKNVKKEKNDKNEKNINIEFENFWNLYNYKVGSKSKVLKKWKSLTDLDRGMIMEHLPHYVKSTPDKQFRKHPATYLNNQGWFDEIVISQNGAIDFKLDSTGNSYMGYCDKCNRSDFYKKEDLHGDSRCCDAKILKERKKYDKKSN